VILISGSGSNLQAIIDAQESGSIPVRIRAVISNRPGVTGLARAEKHGIPFHVVEHTAYASREAFDAALMATIDRYQPALVVLAGFMRILTPGFAEHYRGHLLNIHPSLLPKYQGLHTHQRAIDNDDKEHGVSVHFVTAELDGGPVVAQRSVPVLAGDTAESLAARVLVEEHKLYPEVIGWFAEKRLTMRDNAAFLDGNKIELAKS